MTYLWMGFCFGIGAMLSIVLVYVLCLLVAVDSGTLFRMWVWWQAKR